jgi:hypothetical protein
MKNSLNSEPAKSLISDELDLSLPTDIRSETRVLNKINGSRPVTLEEADEDEFSESEEEPEEEFHVVKRNISKIEVNPKRESF